MNRSYRLRNITNRRQDLWNDSEIDTSSSSSDHENKKISLNKSETSSDENNELSRSTCCFICSILPNLSNVNTCRKHLALLTKSLTPTQVVYLMHPAINNCHCQTKSKHRYRSSSSSSSSESGHHRKKRSMTVQSSDNSSQEDLFFSPNVQSQSHRSNHVQPRLSPSLPPSSIINKNINKNYNELLLTKLLQKNKNERESTLDNSRNKSIEDVNSPNVIEIDSDLSCSPRISLNRIVHVKDEDEILNDNDQKKSND